MGRGIQMGKIKRKSIPSSLFRYLGACFVVCAVGAFLLLALSEYLESWYNARMTFYNSTSAAESAYDGRLYTLLHFVKFAIIPMWTVLCLWITVRVFYRREMKEPIDALTQAADRILSDDLDFTVECRSENELGQLCTSFEEMKRNLYDSNYELWKSLEERKRLNSAFSHDLRTPITVLKGYSELVKKNDGKFSTEKQGEIFRKMSVQIERLERYTEKMTGLHKLEDIIPEQESCSFGRLCGQLREAGKLLCGDISFVFNMIGAEDKEIYTDIGLVMQVYENILGNALRYTESSVDCTVSVNEKMLNITVEDNGSGFSEKALRKAWQPFYRDENEDEKEHFGLGLYICRLLCRKCGGDITVSNGGNGGGRVNADFSVKKPESR